jgi:hypothetical protein
MNNKVIAPLFLATYERYYSIEAILSRMERKKALHEIAQRLENARIEAKQAREISEKLS